jgi:hypothetical protein
MTWIDAGQMLFMWLSGFCIATAIWLERDAR